MRRRRLPGAPDPFPCCRSVGVERSGWPRDRRWLDRVVLRRCCDGAASCVFEDRRSWCLAAWVVVECGDERVRCGAELRDGGALWHRCDEARLRCGELQVALSAAFLKSPHPVS